MTKAPLFLWEILQNIVGIVLLPFFPAAKIVGYKDRRVRICPSFPGGISLGSFIFLSSEEELSFKHEYGHSVQSKILGPFYLFVVGIPSIIWAGLYGNIIKPSKNRYYAFYTEKWADKLGKINRD